ncbi:MAG: carbon-nitrogen hydrolase family protein [bacterium]|nr:carbon-nitrogen hydrolase family protein [bacterium]
MLRAAAVQICPVDGDAGATLDKAEQWLARAGEGGVKLAVLPEGYLPGFATIREAKESGDPQRLAEVFAAFDTVPGAATGRVGDIARRFGMVVAFGMLARAAEGERPTNVSVLIDENGGIANVHRKIHLTPTIEAPDFTPGNSLAVADTAAGCVGNMICADFSLPETTRILAIKGARVICGSLAGFYVPGPDAEQVVLHLFEHSHTSPTRAIDNSVYLVLANMVGRSGDLEFFGKSRIINPEGRILAEGGEGADCEELVIADIDPSIDRGDMPFRLIDRRRPDLYEDILLPNPNLGAVEWQG